MPSDDTKILEFNHFQKYDRAPFIIYEDIECIIGKIDGCKNNQVFQCLQYVHLDA